MSRNRAAQSADHSDAAQRFSQWPHRVAVALLLVSFPLIWFGGLVTSYDAGMAVPDWPTTYGYNMFLYPISWWFFGPWDFFLEHGHRLIGSLAGIVAIVLVIVCWQSDPRRWVLSAAIGLLLLIICQGLLGGIRVTSDDRILAKVHGCFGPAFFACTAAFCVATSRWWRTTQRQSEISTLEKRVMYWSWFWLLLSYLQLVVGAFIRHISDEASPKSFLHLVYLHVTIAVVLLAGTHFHGRRVRRLPNCDSRLLSSIRWLMLLVGLQFILGLTTWVVKFGWPWWFDQWFLASQFVIAEKSFWQMNTITLHVATGSAILAMWAVHASRATRLFWSTELPETN